jgi:hypothetical protein
MQHKKLGKNKMNAIDQLKSVLCGPDGKCCIAGADEDRLIIDRALAALAHLVQPEQEPVVTKGEKGLTLHVGWDDLPAGTKLYASPPPRQPLTDEEIETIIRTKHFSPLYVKRNSDLVILDWYRLGLRDGEAAHGIGDKT